MGKAVRAIHGDVSRHHGYGRCRFVVDLEVKAGSRWRML
jgi:hypothetical protein